MLLSDIEMPGEDGHSLIRRVRALPAGPRRRRSPRRPSPPTPGPRTAQKALLAGFQVHVAKPVQPEELTAVIAELAGRRVVGPIA